jgi:hypothetical protein
MTDLQLQTIGLLDPSIYEAAKAGEIAPLLVIGVEVYKEPSTLQDHERIDMSRPCPFDINYFFGGKHAQIIDLLNPLDYFPLGLDKVKSELRKRNVRQINVLNEAICEFIDNDSCYVLTPLDDSYRTQDLMPLGTSNTGLIQLIHNF